MLNRRFIGSQLAFLNGTVVMLGELGTLGEGLLIGPIMVLGAAAYASRKRRRLGLEPETTGLKVFEGLCLGLIATMSLAELMATDPVPFLMIVPLWALIAYPCAGFRIARIVAEPGATAPESTRWSATRGVLWSISVAIALLVAGTITVFVAGRIAAGFG